jgi:hypothetical protein
MDAVAQPAQFPRLVGLAKKHAAECINADGDHFRKKFAKLTRRAAY